LPASIIEVQIHDPLPGVHRIVLGLEEHVAGSAADGIDDDVETAEVLHRLGDGGLGLFRLGQIGRDREGFFPEFLDQSARCLHL